jgi:enediyne polyketide synthase
MEAMAQTAMALLESPVQPSLEKVELMRPVNVRPQGATRIRLVALRRGLDLVEVCLRSEETEYQFDHFRALCRFAPPPRVRKQRLNGAIPSKWSDRGRGLIGPAPLPFDPKQDLYDGILFQAGRFRRLAAYHFLTARECVAELDTGAVNRWFGGYLPQDVVLSDPGARDAALHAIQACIPHQRILPTGIDEITFHDLRSPPRFVHARQRERHGDDFLYDVEIFGPTGKLLESWEGLHLRAVSPLPVPKSWPLPLLAPYLGRRLEELAGDCGVGVVLQQGVNRKLKLVARAGERTPTDGIIHQALGNNVAIWRRPDGKPVTTTRDGISAAHCQQFTLAVAGKPTVACDLESVSPQTTSLWRSMLGANRCALAQRIARDRKEEQDVAATRLWTAAECLKKAGFPPEAPLVLETTTADGWALLRCGTFAIATCIAAVRGAETALVAAIGFDKG